MRTVLLLKSDYERIGGPETLLRSLADSFDLERVRPILATIRRPGVPPTAVYPDRIQQVVLPWHGLLSLPTTVRALARLARDSGADVINTHDMRANMLAAALRSFTDLPWIANVHGWLGASHHGRWKLYEAIDRRLVRRADRVIVGSAAAAAEVREAGARTVVVIPNAVAVPPEPMLEFGRNERRQTLGLAPDTVVLGMLGRLHPGKGHGVFLRACADLLSAPASRPIHALIVGEGPAGAELQALADSLGIARHVTFTGFVDDAMAWIPAMDLVAVPSIKDSLPLTALEAMAHARPVIASAVGDLPVAVQDGSSGFIVPIGDAAALAGRLRELIDDEALRHRLGQAARRRVIAQYSTDAMARSFEDQYDAICAPTGRDHHGR